MGDIPKLPETVIRAASPPILQGPVSKIESRLWWPTAVGILGILFACIHFLGGGCLMLAPLILGGTSATGPHADWFEASKPPLAIILILGLGVICLSIMLFVGSIRLISRHPSGGRLTRVWSWVFIPWVVGWMTVQFVLQPPIPPDLEALGPSRHLGGILGFIVLQTLFYGWPVFLICWFARPSVRQEVAKWADHSPDDS